MANKKQATLTTLTTRAAEPKAEADSTLIAEIMVSLSRILDLAAKPAGDDLTSILIEREAQLALKAAHSLSEPALVAY